MLRYQATHGIGALPGMDTLVIDVPAVALAAYDAAHAHPDDATRKQNQAFYEFLVPLHKGYATEIALEAASLGIQVHGGMGYIEETGAAQYLRDARILTIYEGTTAIQANDLVGRKTLRDGGRTARAIAARIEATEGELAASGSAAAQAVARRLAAARREAPLPRSSWPVSIWQTTSKVWRWASPVVAATR